MGELVSFPDENAEWPSGSYGLMKTAHGCPSDSKWQSGWREQDLEDRNTANKFSPNITQYMAGTFRVFEF